MEPSSLFNASEQELIGMAVNLLSSVCDKANKRDNLGFNKADARKGHHLSVLPLDEWSDVDYAFCWAILFKYQNQLEGLFKVSIRDLYVEKLKGVKKKDITVVLQEVRNKIKDHVNEKHLVFATNERLTLVYNDTKHSSSVEAAFRFISAHKIEHETNVTWDVDTKYCKGFYYILKNLVGLSKVHFCTGAITRLEVGYKDEIPLAELLEAGFDERDVVIVTTDDSSSPMPITLRSRRSYTEAKKLTKLAYDEEKLEHHAIVAFQSDYKCIATLVSAFKFKIRINGKLSSLMEFVGAVKARLIPRGYFEYRIENKYVIIQDKQELINPKFLTSRGAKAMREKDEVKVGVYSLKGMTVASRFLSNIGITLSRNEIEQIRNALVVKAELAPAIERSIKLAEGKYFIKFKFDESVLKLIKESVPYEQRSFNQNDRTWVINKDLLTDELITKLIAEHKFVLID